jgi:hypothetical protein
MQSPRACSETAEICVANKHSYCTWYSYRYNKSATTFIKLSRVCPNVSRNVWRTLEAGSQHERLKSPSPHHSHKTTTALCCNKQKGKSKTLTILHLRRYEKIEMSAETGGNPLLSEADVAALSDDHKHCLVCYSDLTLRGKAPCNHNDICGVCHLRLRSLHGDKKCPICKNSNDTIIVDEDVQKVFTDYPMWGNEIGSGFVHREEVGMFFESTYYYADVLPLFGYSCNECPFSSEIETGKKTTALRSLQDHLRTQHRLALCELCIDNKRDFVSCLPRMTPKQLQNHFRTGDGPKSGFFGHPVCEFCKPKRFYDLGLLHQHLHKEHYECHVCKKQGIENQFFKNYKSLERHFDQQHFLCHDVQCLAARFLVFENEIDLSGHELSVHGGTSTGSTKINLEFRTRRVGYDGSGLDDQQAPPSNSDFNYGLDGQSFVPAALPNPNGNSANSALHPLHIQRTGELQAQAAAIREQQVVQAQEDSFPTLQSSNAMATSSAPLVGWASASTAQRLERTKKNSGKVTEEDFPALPSSRASAKKKAMKGNVGVARRQFAAMQTSGSTNSYGAAATKPQSTAPSFGYFASTSPATSINRQANLAPDNFPALGGSSRPAPYAAATAYAKKSLKGNATAPSLNNASDFPSMSSTTKPAPRTKPAATAPSLSSSIDFPPPPSAASDNNNSLRQSILGNSKSSSHQAMSNVLQAPSATATATVEEMKASLGSKTFKHLKRMTREFAEGQLPPDAYVDQSAALFDRGYGDKDFWSFLPSLIESCPNEQGSEQALRYMSSLKQTTLSPPSRTGPSLSATPPASSNWGGNNALATNVMKAPARASAPAATRMTRPMVGGRSIAAVPNTIASKKKGAWGGTGAATVVRAKAPPGSVSAAAATQGPQGGTATKFMAKQQKKQNNQSQQQQQHAGGKTKNKKKAKDELRALAFGK